MKWIKLGKIFCPDNNFGWMSTHAMIPFAEHISDDLFKVYFSVRDKYNKGHLASLEIDIKDPLKFYNLSSQPLFEPGKLGCFDDSGVIGELIIHKNNQKFLYYTGICLGVTVPIRNSIGIAKWVEREKKFVRCFEGPIIDRTKEEPHFTATPEIIYDNDIYKAWYTSCTKWVIEDGKPKHYYHLKYAESKDGLIWERKGIVAIDFKNKYEYAIGVPRVMKENGLYKMWFCSRADQDHETYRIKYAESRDGINWVRKDDEVGITISENGWDSQMICYPFILNHKKNKYMFYNGNHYGKTGFGIAILE